VHIGLLGEVMPSFTPDLGMARRPVHACTGLVRLGIGHLFE